MRTPEHESPEAVLGASRNLPWPLDVAARRAWDEGTLWYRRRRHAWPIGVVQRLAASSELLQRRDLAVWCATAARSTRVLLAGNDPLLRATLLAALGAGSVERRPSVARASAGPTARFAADLVTLEIPSARAADFARAGWLVLPRWVAMEVDLRRPERELWDAHKRESVRRVERSGFEFELARGAEAARDFHRRLYVPMARARHGSRAIVLRLGHVEAALRSGWLLFARSGGERRAALLVVPRVGGPRAVDALMFGVAHGEYAGTELAREAAYLFGIRWARDQYGASTLGLTGAAPLVHDGILRFKKRWGATAVADRRQASCVALRVSRGSPELCRALAERPLIAFGRRAGADTLCALLPRSTGTAPVAIPSTPGVEAVDLELGAHSELPRRLEAWARAAAP